MLVSVERKRSERVELAKPLERFVKSTYDERALEAHQAHINALATLREDARRPDANRDVLVHYHTLLRSLELRFPISESNLRIWFGWTDVFKGKKAGMYSASWERANVLFNVAAACSAAGAATALDGAEGPKIAAGHFQQAAGTFLLLAEQLAASHPDFQTQLLDLAPDFLRAAADAMLGNAQYCWFLKASRSAVSKSVLSKLAAQAAAFYESAARAVQQSAQLKDATQKAWLPHVEALAELSRAEAAMLLGDELEQAMRYGERVARFAQAVALAESARKRIAKVGTPELKRHADSIAQQATRDHAKAMRENDTISHEQIPPASALAPLEGRAMAKPAESPAATAPEEDPFSDLVPFAIRQAAAVYAERRDAMVQQEGKTVSDANEDLKQTLNGCSLPGALEALEAPEGLPPALAEKAKAVRAEGGAQMIGELRDTLGKLSQTDREILVAAERVLDEEERDDNELRTQHGPRWTRTPSHTLTTALRQELSKHHGNMEHATKSDALVASKWDRVAATVEKLGHSDAEILASIPRGGGSGGSASQQGIQQNPAVLAIKADLDTLNGVLAERLQAFDALKEMAAHDDPSGALMAVISQGEAAFEGVFQQQLAKYDAVLGTLHAGYQRQVDALAKLRQDNTAFTALRQSSSGPRDGALQAFADAYSVYTEVCGNLREGIQFYTNFQEVLNRFKVKCEDFVFARRTEKEDLLEQVNSRQGPAPGYVPQSTSLYGAPHQQPSPPPPARHHQQPQQPQQQQQQQPPPGAWQPTTAPQYSSQMPGKASPPPSQPHPGQAPLPYPGQPGQPYSYSAPQQYGQQPPPPQQYQYQQPPPMPYTGAPGWQQQLPPQQYGGYQQPYSGQPMPPNPYGGYAAPPGYPGQPQGYPGQPQPGYPGQPQPQGYPGQPQQQGYPYNSRR